MTDASFPAAALRRHRCWPPIPAPAGANAAEARFPRLWYRHRLVAGDAGGAAGDDLFRRHRRVRQTYLKSR